MDVQTYSGAFDVKKQTESLCLLCCTRYIHQRTVSILSVLSIQRYSEIVCCRCLPSAERLLFLCFGFHVLPVACSAKLSSLQRITPAHTSTSAIESICETGSPITGSSSWSVRSPSIQALPSPYPARYIKTVLRGTLCVFCTRSGSAALLHSRGSHTGTSDAPG